MAEDLYCHSVVSLSDETSISCTATAWLPRHPWELGSAGWGGKLRSTVLILLVGTKLFFICELYLDDIFDHCLLVNSAVYHEAVKVEKTAHKAEITCALCC